jgi:serine/threonine protein phosphatase 1
VLFETDKYIFVHGGLIPQDSIENVKELMKDETKRETLVNAMLWAREDFINSEWDWGKKVVFGHTPAYKPWWGKFGQPIIMKNKIGIDGAACGNKIGSSLIAVELPEERFYSQGAFALQEAIKNI